ncbi:MAG: putative dehydrogenase [bacterium]|jgi:predicted dehydrogenase
MNIAVIGYGYWGPNLVRNFSWTEGITVKYVCDLNEDRLSKVNLLFPNVQKITTDIQEVMNDPEVEAVAIATPVHTHYDLAKQALLAGKHVLVEKPMTDSSKKAKELVDIAEEKGLTLMVDHTFLFTGAVRKIKELVDSGALGEIYYFDSVRVNLGLFQSDVNVVWDLAPHDLSIMRYVIDKKPVSVSATGVAHVGGSDLENIAYMNVYYDDNTLAHFHVNWLSPIKIRQVLIGGSEKMIVYDDMDNAEKVKVYDKGVDTNNDKDKIYQALLQYRIGDMYAPKLDGTEALKLECAHFLECIQEKKQPISDGKFGLEIVQMLEAAQISIKQQGTIIHLDELC